MKTKDLVFAAIFAVIISVCAWISIPAPVPFTLQTFAIFAALYILGGKRATIAILVYIALGAVGIPVFSGFKGGIASLIGATGGYIIGFIFMGLIYWAFEKFLGQKLWYNILAMVVGLLVCYAFGTAWFMIVYAQKSGAIGISTALMWCVIPFIIPDLLKMALAVLISKRVKPAIKNL